VKTAQTLLTGIIAVAAFCGLAATYVEVHLTVAQTNFAPVVGKATSGVGRQVQANRAGSWTARCIVGQQKWYIENDFCPGTREAYYHDGTNVYHTTEFVSSGNKKESPAVEQVRKLLPLLSSTGAADGGWKPLTITPGEHPLDNFGVNLPWTAFCSGHYLGLADRLIPLPGAEIRHVPGSFGFRDLTEVFPDGLGLPSRISLFASARLLEKAVRHESLLRGDDHVARLRLGTKPTPILPDGFVKARYEVLSSTNIAGWSFPTAFTYSQYAPSHGGVAVGTLTARGDVVGIKLATEPDMVVSVSERYSVVDYRFRDRTRILDEIHYSLSNQLIQPVSAAALQALYREKQSRAARDPVRLGVDGRRIAVVGLLVITLVVPTVLAIVWRVRRKEMKTAQRKE
jgi:hypothetical protein